MAATNTSTSSTLVPAITADITSSSLYYLHPYDNPGALSTSVLLRGDNYNEWATKLSNSIQAKQKLGFINGTIPKPSSEPELSRWLTTNACGLDPHVYLRRPKDSIHNILCSRST